MGENLFSRIAQLKHFLSVQGWSAPPTQRTSNLNPFAPPQHYSSAPASVGSVNMVAMITALNVRVVAFQAEVNKLKRGSNDTVLKVGFDEFL